MGINATDLRRAIDLLERSDWQGAHALVQEDEDSPLACWAHGIVHLMEGDLPNARYWYGRAQRVLPKSPSIADEIAALKAAA